MERNEAISSNIEESHWINDVMDEEKKKNEMK